MCVLFAVVNQNSIEKIINKKFYFYVYIQRRRRATDRLHLQFPFSRRIWRSRSSPFPVNRQRRRELRRGS